MPPLGLFIIGCWILKHIGCLAPLVFRWSGLIAAMVPALMIPIESGKRELRREGVKTSFSNGTYCREGAIVTMCLLYVT